MADGRSCMGHSAHIRPPMPCSRCITRGWIFFQVCSMLGGAPPRGPYKYGLPHFLLPSLWFLVGNINLSKLLKSRGYLAINLQFGKNKNNHASWDYGYLPRVVPKGPAQERVSIHKQVKDLPSRQNNKIIAWGQRTRPHSCFFFFFL